MLLLPDSGEFYQVLGALNKELDNEDSEGEKDSEILYLLFIYFVMLRIEPRTLCMI